MWDNLKQLIDKNEVISFDIFDTLLFRPFMEPSDVCTYISQLQVETDFKLNRTFAEVKARIKYCKGDVEDVTYEQIYEFIGNKYKSFYEVERNFEKEILVPNKNMLEVFNYALSKNKTVIITSDMYYSADFLNEILTEKGFKGYKKIYVSSEYKKTKGSGNLYKIILKDLNILPDKMLHIGDNYGSDILKPKELGINTFYFEKIKEQFINDEKNKFLINFYNEYKNSINATASLILGLRIIDWFYNPKREFWENIGYQYGGVIIYSIIQAVIEIIKCKHITDVFFIARDSYPLKKAFDMLNTTNAKGHYVYANRNIKYQCVNDEYSNGQYSQESDKEYEKYINSLNLRGGGSANVLIIDSCAVNYSAQILLRKYLKNIKLLGCYFTSRLNYKLDYINLTGIEQEFAKFNWQLTELLLTAPTPQILGLKNNQPIFMQENDINYKYEMERINVFNKIFKGEMDYIKDCLNIFKSDYINFKFPVIVSYLENFDNNLTQEDYKILNALKHPYDKLSKKYTLLYRQKYMKKTDKLIKTQHEEKQNEGIVNEQNTDMFIRR